MSRFDDPFFNDDGPSSRNDDPFRDDDPFDDDAAGTAAGGVIGGVISMLCCCGIIGAVVYFVCIRPSQQRRAQSSTQVIVTRTQHPGQAGIVQVSGNQSQSGQHPQHQQFFGNPQANKQPGGMHPAQVPPSPYAQQPQQHQQPPAQMGQFEHIAFALSTASSDTEVGKLLQQLRQAVADPSVQKPGDARNRLHANKLAGSAQHPAAWGALNSAEFGEIITMLPPDAFRPPGQPDYEAIAAQQAQQQAYSLSAGQPPPQAPVPQPGGFGGPGPAASPYGGPGTPQGGAASPYPTAPPGGFGAPPPGAYGAPQQVAPYPGSGGGTPGGAGGGAPYPTGPGGFV